MSSPTNRMFGSRQRRLARVTLAGSTAVFAATALLDLIGRPAMDNPNHHLSGAAAYGFTAMLLPFASAAVGIAWTLRSYQPDRKSTRALWLVVAAAAGFWICGIGSLVTANSRFGGPLYPASMLASLSGLTILVVVSAKTRTLSLPMAAAIPVAWFIGGPIGEGNFFRGSGLVLAATTAALAVVLCTPDSTNTNFERQQALAARP